MNQNPRLSEDSDHDVFMENTLRAADFVREHQSKLIIAAVAIVAIVLGGVWMKEARETAAGDAAVLLNRGLQYFDAEQYIEARPWLERTRSEFDGSAASQEATYLLASIESRNGNFDEAARLFEEAIHSHMENGFLLAASHAGLAYCLEQEEAWEEAAAQFAKAGLSFPENFNAPYHLLAAALCYERAGKKEDALPLLERIIEKHEDSPQKARAELVLKRMDHMHH